MHIIRIYVHIFKVIYIWASYRNILYEEFFRVKVGRGIEREKIKVREKTFVIKVISNFKKKNVPRKRGTGFFNNNLKTGKLVNKKSSSRFLFGYWLFGYALSSYQFILFWLVVFWKNRGRGFLKPVPDAALVPSRSTAGKIYRVESVARTLRSRCSLFFWATLDHWKSTRCETHTDGTRPAKSRAERLLTVTMVTTEVRTLWRCARSWNTIMSRV